MISINRYVFITRYFCFYLPFIRMYCFYIFVKVLCIYGMILIFAQETFSSTDTGFGIDPFGGRVGT